ncbi:uncharacterized protein STEHIDRAFT_116440 [Stereum hirsutum FP-91666 SS1]|uniref:PHD-type domain-containing protein n=1 Tax=Stereum hirsutum (strain FP-91666) TaxID=721885 RepID=R7RW60_STEHR|nr:uncharacterized protein STEHIDRAFT_116440 [Stereum hirsutum FP-91666 SS1]EIM79531.1 hypothetical protein STEHIDRAFT_116440 [Stereum hirsutum FP-91666 SS1]
MHGVCEGFSLSCRSTSTNVQGPDSGSNVRRQAPHNTTGSSQTGNSGPLPNESYVVEGPTFNRMLAIVVGEAEKAKTPRISQDMKATSTEPKSATLHRKPSLTKTKVARKITSQERKVEDTVDTDDDEEEGDKRAREQDGDSDKGDNDPNYPSGSVHRRFPVGSEPPGWKIVKWATRSSGKQKWKGHNAKRVRCIGIYVCNNPTCKRTTRPLTNDKRRQEQAMAMYTWTEMGGDGLEYSCWEHDGVHTHERPPGGAVSPQEEAEIDAQATRRPTAHAHALRTGDALPGSKPLADINPKLADPRAARYQLAKSQERTGIRPAGSSKSGFSVLEVYRKLREEYGSTFLLDMQVFSESVIVLQTPWMKERLGLSVNSWLQEGSGPSILVNTIQTYPGHGNVTDADNKYFRHGYLLVSVGFDTTLESWVPALYTWDDRLDTAHIRHHFRWLFKSIIDHADERFEPKLLFNIMDFSQAQDRAHEIEFAETMITRQHATYEKLPEAIRAQTISNARKAYLDEAAKYRRGCDVHFMRSATRLKRNGTLVPPEHTALFDEFCHLAIGRDTTRSQFSEAVEHIRTTLPRIRGWLAWWLRASVRTMAFPCHSVSDPEDLDQTPNNSNPVETQHSLLHHAVGTDHDLIPGVQNLYLHAKEMEKRTKSIEGNSVPLLLLESIIDLTAICVHVEGHIGPSRGPKTGRRTLKPWAVNDGRAPDTYELLRPTMASGTPHHSSSSTDSLDATNESSLPTSPAPSILRSYKWAKNSCFFDVGHELLFRFFMRLRPPQRLTLRQLFHDSSSPLAEMLYQFDVRCRWTAEKGAGSDRHTDKGTRILGIAQSKLRYYISDRWNDTPAGKFGHPTNWIQRLLEVRLNKLLCGDNPDEVSQDNTGGTFGNEDTIRLHFGIQQRVVRICGNGHSQTATVSTITTGPFVMSEHDKSLARIALSLEPTATITIQQYFQFCIPRIADRTSAKEASEMIHNVTVDACHHPGCTERPHNVETLTSWPELLQIIPDTIDLNPHDCRPVQPLASFSISSPVEASPEDATGFEEATRYEDIGYDFIGRIIFLREASHFQAEILIEDRVYVYDDVENGGFLQDIGDVSVIERSNVKTSLLMYYRRTPSSTSRRSVAQIVKLLSQGPVAIDGYGLVPANPIRPDSPTPPPQTALPDRPNTKPATPDTVDELISATLDATLPRPQSPSESDTSDSVDDTQALVLHRNNEATPENPTFTLYPDCIGCYGDLDPDEVDVSRTLECNICQRRSHVSCIEFQWGLPHGYPVSQYWRCYVCSRAARERPGSVLWSDAKYINQYILLQTREKSKTYYAAKILRREGRSAVLKWFDCNKYSPMRDKPLTDEFKFPTQRAVEAAIAMYKNAENAGHIYWPLQLCEDARDKYRYANPTIQAALEDAFGAIIAILTGARKHPVMSGYSNWLNTAAGRQNLLRRGHDWANTTFNIPILPGDSSLLAPYLSHMLRVLADRMPDWTGVLRSQLIFEPGTVLLQLVILRTYLRLSPKHDNEIFDLVTSRRIVNRPSEWQQVARVLDQDFQADIYEGVRTRNSAQDSDDGSSIGIPEPMITDFCGMYKLKDLILRYRPEMDILEGIVGIKSSNGQPYIWRGSSENQLSGGEPYSSFRPRPRALAAKRTQASLDAPPDMTSNIVEVPASPSDPPEEPPKKRKKHNPADSRLHHVEKRSSARLKAKAKA